MMKNDYIINGDITTIFLKHKNEIIETFISTPDLERAKEFPNTWHARWSSLGNTFYVDGNSPRVKGKRTTIPFARWLLNAPKGLVVDHINHNTLDNRRENLNLVTHKQNMQNRSVSRNSKTKIRGVNWCKSANKWRVQVGYKHIGVFDDIKEAEKAAIKARKKLMPYSTLTENLGGKLNEFTGN